MTLLLHSLSANYNQYAASKNQSQLGDRGAGTLVATPSGRGPDGFYAGIAEADTFEVWADVARHYALDPDWTVVSGYSMGAFGTFRMLARWPDLFARGMSTVGMPGTASDQLASLRNTPIMTWNAAGDELVNIRGSEQMVTDMTNAGIRFVHWLFPGSDHLTLATNDEYGPAAEFLGTHRVDRDPPHVTYVVDVAEDSTAAAAIGDHAYWLSGLRLAKEDPRRGTIDVRSAGFGVGDAEVLPVQTSQGSLQGGAHGPMPYQERKREWGEVPLSGADEQAVRAREQHRSGDDRLHPGAGRMRPEALPGGGRAARPGRRLREKPKRAKRCARNVSVTLPRIASRPNVEVAARRGPCAEARGGGADPAHDDPPADPARVRAGLRGAGRRRRPGEPTLSFHAAVRAPAGERILARDAGRWASLDGPPRRSSSSTSRSPGVRACSPREAGVVVDVHTAGVWQRRGAPDARRVPVQTPISRSCRGARWRVLSARRATTAKLEGGRCASHPCASSGLGGGGREQQPGSPSRCLSHSTFAQGAGLILNYHTAYFSLKLRGADHGAAGGVGTAGIQVAKGLGARTIACVSSDEKEQVGARRRHRRGHKSDGDWKDQVKGLSDGSMNVVLDPGPGGNRFTDSLRSLAGAAGGWSGPPGARSRRCA